MAKTYSANNNHAADNLLCIPIKVQAMMVGKSPVPTVFANIPDDYSRLAINPLGDYVPSGIMNEKTEEKSGVHLHWVLPDGLRHGRQASDESSPEYPRVPNRWIISRIWAAKAQPDVLHGKHWIVESDALEKTSSPEQGNDGSLTYPKLDDLKLPYRILGRSFAYEDSMPEPAERLDALTALGPGNPSFSVMYPYHRNVFGFYDDLTTAAGQRLEEISISYVVRGFYSDELPIMQSADICRTQFGWQPPDNLQYPATLALHGIVTDLDWRNDSTDYNSPVIGKLPVPKLAVGNTSAEAVSALHGEHDPANEHAMRLLLNDHSHKLLNLNGIYKADYGDHGRRFQLYAEQRTYKLQSKLNDQDYEDLPALSPEEQIVFRNLQAGMQELYRKQFSADAKRSFIYELWCKYMIKAQVTDPFEKKEAEKLMLVYQQQIEQELEAIEQAELEIRQLQERLAGLEQQFTAHESYQLEQTAGSRYYEPNSPVLLLSGAKRGALFEPGEAEKLLKGRLLAESVSALQVEFMLRGQHYKTTIHASQLLAQPEVKGLYSQLLLEALLFSSNSTELIIARIGQQLDLLPFSEAEHSELLETVHQLQRSMTQGLVQQGEKFPDPLFLNVWSAPWNPVMLCWRGLYYPDKALVSSLPELGNWTFEGSDYRFHGTLDTKASIAIEGRILLSPHVAAQLHAMSVKHLGAELTSAIGALEQLDYLSQALDGFNERFLMNQLALRFPVLVLQKGSAQLAEQVSEALASLAIEKPLFNTFFSPLRGGFFKFDQLRLIDTFGQFQNIAVTEYAIAENMRVSQETLGQYIMLPPRFMQPTRLEFNWIQARGQQVCDFNLRDSPICGWLIPNHADQSLLVYDEEGVMLGSLVTTGFAGDSVQWRNAPGMPFTSSESFFSQDVAVNGLPAMMNPDMKAFLTEILQRSQQQQEDVLTPLLQLIDSALWNIDSQQSATASGLSLYVGKPLVLAKASIKLLQYGPPQAYKALDSSSKKPAPVPDTSIQQFQMPLWIGEKHHTGDGIVGFFKQDGQTDYRQFNSAYVESDDISDYLKANYQVDIAANEHADETRLSLIMDPLASIHLISGMLPVSEQRLPQNRIESALSKLFLTVYVGPMLVGEESYVMPLTKLPNRNWSFITPGEAAQWLETEKLQPANENAFLAKPPYRAVEGWLKLNVEEAHEGDAE